MTTLDRLTEILDAYGADPNRWPAAERADALALVAVSPDARDLVAAAARLDAVLDALPPAQAPSAALRARIVAAAPARSRPRRVAAVLAPLAAAAVLAIWLVRSPEPAAVPAADVPMAQLGVYETPTDELLTLDELDVVDDDPSVTRDTGRMHA